MSLTLTGLTGEGVTVLDPGFTVAVKDISYQVTAWPMTIRQFGGDHPYGLWNIGTIALGWDTPNSDWGMNQYGQYWFIHYESGDLSVVPQNATGAITYTAVFWRLKVGVTMSIIVGW